MTSPLAAQGVRRAFPGALFGSKIVSPLQKLRPQLVRSAPLGKIWGTDIGSVESLSTVGTGAAFVGVPPDGAVFDVDSFFPGGSDGTFNYLLVVNDDTDRNLYVDKFDAPFATLLDRWLIPGWPEDPTSGLFSVFPSTDIQHVSASTTRIVVIDDLYDPDDIDPITGGAKHYLGVAVFDTTGTLLDQYQIYTTVDGGDGVVTEGTLNRTGSFCDGHNVYFAHEVLVTEDFGDGPFLTTDIGYAKVGLGDGVLTDLFSAYSVSQLSPDPAVSWVSGQGIVAVDDTGSGDLILVGDDIARVQQDGTPVWFTANPNPWPGSGPFLGFVAFYQALTRSGHNSVWASGPPDELASASPITHEFTYTGTYVRAGAWAEPVDHTWLGPTP